MTFLILMTITAVIETACISVFAVKKIREMWEEHEATLYKEGYERARKDYRKQYDMAISSLEENKRYKDIAKTVTAVK